jgi:hypothetical protein
MENKLHRIVEEMTNKQNEQIQQQVKMLVDKIVGEKNLALNLIQTNSNPTSQSVISNLDKKAETSNI